VKLGLSSPAKAGDPVTIDGDFVQILALTSASVDTGCPAFAGHDRAKIDPIGIGRNQ
jgi:hypothetical protein